MHGVFTLINKMSLKRLRSSFQGLNLCVLRSGTFLFGLILPQMGLTGWAQGNTGSIPGSGWADHAAPGHKRPIINLSDGKAEGTGRGSGGGGGGEAGSGIRGKHGIAVLATYSPCRPVSRVAGSGHQGVLSRAADGAVGPVLRGRGPRGPPFNPQTPQTLPRPPLRPVPMPPDPIPSQHRLEASPCLPALCGNLSLKIPIKP